jgi:hypothetical protein
MLMNNNGSEFRPLIDTSYDEIIIKNDTLIKIKNDKEDNYIDVPVVVGNYIFNNIRNDGYHEIINISENETAIQNIKTKKYNIITKGFYDQYSYIDKKEIKNAVQSG